MTLADTSVWVEHLRRGNARMAGLLSLGQVLCHPFVLGELACGNLQKRHEVLALLAALPAAELASQEEVLHLVDTYQLFDRGLEWVDVRLLASTLLSKCGLWTKDKPLAAAAEGLGIAVKLAAKLTSALIVQARLDVDDAEAVRSKAQSAKDKGG